MIKMMALSSVVVLCLAGILGTRYSDAWPTFPITPSLLKSEMEAGFNKTTVKNTPIVESLKPYQTLEFNFAVTGLTVLRVLRQNQKERFGSSEEEISKTFQSAYEVKKKVGLVGPFLETASGELTRLSSWKNTASNNLDTHGTQRYTSFGTLPYFCRKFFTRNRSFERITVYLVAAQQEANNQTAAIKKASAQLTKLLEYLETHFKDETKQAKDYANEVCKKDQRVAEKAVQFVDENTDLTFNDALKKARAVVDDGGSRLRAAYDWVREDEHFFNCAPFNGKDVFQAAKESSKESGAFVGISKGGYIAIANTIVLLLCYSI